MSERTHLIEFAGSVWEIEMDLPMKIAATSTATMLNSTASKIAPTAEPGLVFMQKEQRRVVRSRSTLTSVAG